jgi:hypothetical protein
LVEALSNARALVLPRRNHMNAVGDRDFKSAVVDFFK